MNRLTIGQVTKCVQSATRGATEPLAIDVDGLTEALNAVLASHPNGLPETHMPQWCDVCQRNVDTDHAHDKMVQNF